MFFLIPKATAVCAIDFPGSSASLIADSLNSDEYSFCCFIGHLVPSLSLIKVILNYSVRFSVATLLVELKAVGNVGKFTKLIHIIYAIL